MTLLFTTKDFITAVGSGAVATYEMISLLKIFHEHCQVSGLRVSWLVSRWVHFGYKDLIHFTVTASQTFALNTSATKINALLMIVKVIQLWFLMHAHIWELPMTTENFNALDDFKSYPVFQCKSINPSIAWHFFLNRKMPGIFVGICELWNCNCKFKLWLKTREVISALLKWKIIWIE